MENAAPTDAKAAALYANTGRAVREAKAKGYDNCVICDHEGYVAEFTVANLFMVKNKIVYTPKPTGTFLVGITRNRVIKLLEKLGIEVIESKIKPEDLIEADEIFCSSAFINSAFSSFDKSFLFISNPSPIICFIVCLGFKDAYGS